MISCGKSFRLVNGRFSEPRPTPQRESYTLEAVESSLSCASTRPSSTPQTPRCKRSRHGFTLAEPYSSAPPSTPATACSLRSLRCDSVLSSPSYDGSPSPKMYRRSCAPVGERIPAEAFSALDAQWKHRDAEADVGTATARSHSVPLMRVARTAECGMQIKY
jgi:hypothetical protein